MIAVPLQILAYCYGATVFCFKFARMKSYVLWQASEEKKTNQLEKKYHII